MMELPVGMLINDPAPQGTKPLEVRFRSDRTLACAQRLASNRCSSAALTNSLHDFQNTGCPSCQPPFKSLIRSDKQAARSIPKAGETHYTQSVKRKGIGLRPVFLRPI